MKKNLITLTAFVGSLILTPVMATTLQSTKKIKRNSISSNISSTLHKRGLDEESAQRITESFIGDDEELFAIMLRNLENGCSILSKNEIINYLSDSALHKKQINFSSYGSLIGMVQKIKKHQIDPHTKRALENIANKNALYINQKSA